MGFVAHQHSKCFHLLLFLFWYRDSCITFFGVVGIRLAIISPRTRLALHCAWYCGLRLGSNGLAASAITKREGTPLEHHMNVGVICMQVYVHVLARIFHKFRCALR